MQKLIWHCNFLPAPRLLHVCTLTQLILHPLAFAQMRCVEVHRPQDSICSYLMAIIACHACRRLAAQSTYVYVPSDSLPALDLSHSLPASRLLVIVLGLTSMFSQRACQLSSLHHTITGSEYNHYLSILLLFIH